MIRIRKPHAPASLAARADAERLALEALYDEDPEAHRDGRRKLKVRDVVYGHPDVRLALSEAQFRKCCYCEALINRPQALEHVEHFRPKGRVRQGLGEEPTLPGYYWLAYEWSNLFMSCHHCNSSRKGDQFPVADPAERPRDHHEVGRMGLEVPLLLDPGSETDFAAHVRFVGDRPTGLTPEGKETIRVVGLADAAHEGRMQYLDWIRELVDEIVLLRRYQDPPLIELVRKRLVTLVKLRRADAPYSAMVRDYLDGLEAL